MPVKFKKDIICILILSAVFIPIYTLFLYEIPQQINTDEIHTMLIEKRVLGQIPNNVLGLSGHFGFPALSFLLYAWPAQLLGGINLANSRFVDAAFALIIIFVSYLFFRLRFTPLISLIASLLMGANHALIAISRMVMINNSGLLAELIGMTALMFAFTRRSLFYALIGGLFCGFTFYSYLSARFTFLFWGLFLFAYAFFYRKKLGLKKIVKFFLITLIGFTLMIFPIVLENIKDHPANHTYQKEQLLIFPEGRTFLKGWESATNELEAIKINIIRGLGVFNNNEFDRGFIYFNPKHGFVDPATGILIWIGVLVVFYRFFIKRKRNDIDLFVLCGFFFLYFVYSFLVTKSPDYTRLLVILPFVAYLSATALVFIINYCISLVKYKMNKSVFIISILLATLLILFWNLQIFADFIKEGFEKGHEVGTTARFMESRSGSPDYSFYLVTNKQQPYYSWGTTEMWQSWFSFFSSKDQKALILEPHDFMNQVGEPPFVIFMNNQLWQAHRESVVQKYLNIAIYNIRSDGSLVAIEVK